MGFPGFEINNINLVKPGSELILTFPSEHFIQVKRFLGQKVVVKSLALSLHKPLKKAGLTALRTFGGDFIFN